MLLILAGISINMLSGENGLLTKTQEAKEADRMSKARETVELAIHASWDEQGNFNKEQFKKEIEKAGGSIVKEEEERIILKVDIYQAIVNIEKAEIIKFGTESTISPNFNINTNITPNNDTIAPKKRIDITASSNTGVSSIKTPDGNVVEGDTVSYTVRANGDYKFVIIDSIGNEKDEIVSVSGLSERLQLFPVPSDSPVSFELGSGGVISKSYSSVIWNAGSPYIHLNPFNSGSMTTSGDCCWNGIDFSIWKTLHVKFVASNPPCSPAFMATASGRIHFVGFERPVNSDWWSDSFNASGVGELKVELQSPMSAGMNVFDMGEVYMTE